MIHGEYPLGIMGIFKKKTIANISKDENASIYGQFTF
jgi:hypothetical protein